MRVRTGQAGGLRRRPHGRRRQLLAARSAASSVDAAASSALRLVRSVHSCAMLAKSVFVLKTKVLCPQLPPAVLFGPPKCPGRKFVKKYNFESSQNGLPIVENLSGPQESIVSLSRRPQLHFGKKVQKLVELS